jgi:hypothetical protein
MRWVQIADCGIPGGIHRPVADDVRGVVTHNPEGAAARGPQAAATGSAPSVTAGTTTTVSAAAATAVSLPPAPTGRAPTIMSPGRRLAGRGSQHQNRSQANGAHRAESFHDGLLSGVARGVTGVIGTNLQRGARGIAPTPPVTSMSTLSVRRETTTVKFRRRVCGISKKAAERICRERCCPRLCGVLICEMRLWESPADVFVDSWRPHRSRALCANGATEGAAFIAPY